ncbi:hypothetical protein KDL67_07470 [bacterium]|nr:hypothetical protein [bacterium]
MNWHRMRRSAALATLLLPLGLACGGNRTTINLDLDSFIDEADRSFTYLVLPGEFSETPSPIEEVETPSGLRDALALESLSVDMQLMLDNTNVIGAVNMRARMDVYVAADDDPASFWDTANRLVSLEGTLNGGEVNTLEQVFSADGFLDLFQQHDIVYVGLLFRLDHLSGTGAVDGDALLTRLHLRAVGREDLF